MQTAVIQQLLSFLVLAFANGEVAEIDEKQAFEWLSKAKDQEKNLNGEACYYLGKFYEEGNVTEKSLDDAEHFISWL